MTRGILATPHRLASEAGAQILRDGGNAVDAAVAANAVLCVVYPHMTTIGGDLFALVWPAGEEEPVVLEAAGWSGAAASISALAERGHATMPERGGLTVTVPGTVKGWGRLIERFGTLALSPLLEPAAAAAQHGFIVTENLAHALAQEAAWLTRERAAAELFPPVKAGMLLRNPDLATTLTSIGRHGFSDFYRGGVARAISESVRRQGGLLDVEDLAEWQAGFARPLALEWRGHAIYQVPPPAQGLALLGMLARFTAPELSPAELRRLRDAVYPLRGHYITDPLFVAVPQEPFLDPAWEEPGLPERHGEGGTVYLCVADEFGNLVSLVQSVAYPFGSGVVAEGTGVLLHNRGAYFSLEPAHANRLEPRKRTMHTLMPGMAGKNRRPWAAFGNMGADAQPQFALQVLSRLAGGEDPQPAVAAPRLRVAQGGSPLLVEADYPGALELQQEFADVRLMPPQDSVFGHAMAIVVDGDGWRAGADPRSDGAVVRV